jgi:hypothetical protein
LLVNNEKIGKSTRVVLGLALGLVVLSVTTVSDSALVQAFNDPTQPSYYEAPKAKKKVKQHWVLQSVLVSKQRRLAVINGKYYAVGDVIGRGTVHSIVSDAVTIKNGNKLVRLPLIKTKVR